MWSTLDEIAANDYNLNITRYVEPRPTTRRCRRVDEAMRRLKERARRGVRGRGPALNAICSSGKGCSAMTARITQPQLETYLWGAATLLRGTIDAGDYKQFIFPLLFFKRLCDVWDEEYQPALEESGGDVEYAAFPRTTASRSRPRRTGATCGGRDERRPALQAAMRVNLARFSGRQQ